MSSANLVHLASVKQECVPLSTSSIKKPFVIINSRSSAFKKTSTTLHSGVWLEEVQWERLGLIRPRRTASHSPHMYPWANRGERSRCVPVSAVLDERGAQLNSSDRRGCGSAAFGDLSCEMKAVTSDLVLTNEKEAAVIYGINGEMMVCFWTETPLRIPPCSSRSTQHQPARARIT